MANRYSYPPVMRRRAASVQSRPATTAASFNQQQHQQLLLLQELKKTENIIYLHLRSLHCNQIFQSLLKSLQKERRRETFIIFFDFRFHRSEDFKVVFPQSVLSFNSSVSRWLDYFSTLKICSIW